jgi:hypothetical protein
MRTCVLAVVMALAMNFMLGCGEDPATTPAPKAGELKAAWTYLGPSDGPHDLVITDETMVYTDVAGAWSSSWKIKAVDNALHHFQVTFVFVSGTGTYLPMGASMSGTYELSGLLTVQLANGLAAYPQLRSPGTCTEAADGTAIPECRTYIKKN